MRRSRLACARCKDEGWVCEAHPDKPWRESIGGCECAPGVPCPDCNHDAADPPGFAVVIDGDGDKRN